METSRSSHFQSPVAAPRRSWLYQVGPGQRGHLDKLSKLIYRYRTPEHK